MPRDLGRVRRLILGHHSDGIPEIPEIAFNAANLLPLLPRLEDLLLEEWGADPLHAWTRRLVGKGQGPAMPSSDEQKRWLKGKAGANRPRGG